MAHIGQFTSGLFSELRSGRHALHNPCRAGFGLILVHTYIYMYIYIYGELRGVSKKYPNNGKRMKTNIQS